MMNHPLFFWFISLLQSFLDSSPALTYFWQNYEEDVMVHIKLLLYILGVCVRARANAQLNYFQYICLGLNKFLWEKNVLMYVDINAGIAGCCASLILPLRPGTLCLSTVLLLIPKTLRGRLFVKTTYI